jgi:hypothetical protein
MILLPNENERQNKNWSVNVLLTEMKNGAKKSKRVLRKQNVNT